MRCLVLSDVHANATALAAALAACAGQWDQVVCLGDLVGYGPDPNEVVEQGCGLGDLEDFNSVARAAVEWTPRHLRPENLRYLADLPAGPLQMDSLTLVHG